MSKQIYHVVWFKYKDGVDQQTRQNIFEAYAGLKQACILNKALEGLPETNAPYILDIKAGHQNSTGAIAAKIDDVFIVTFPTALHRYYYVNLDDAHANFVKEYRGKVDVSVADFENCLAEE